MSDDDDAANGIARLSALVRRAANKNISSKCKCFFLPYQTLSYLIVSCTTHTKSEALTFPWPLISTRVEMKDGFASRHGDSTWMVLSERVDFLIIL